jgi:hypothetical protein
LSASICVRSTSVPDEMKGPKPFVNSATNSGVQVLLLLILLPPALDEEAQSKDNGGFLLFSQTCRLIQGYPRDIREYTPDVRVHAAAPKLGYTRLPRFRVRHLLPRLFRVAFGREGRVARDSPMYFCVGPQLQLSQVEEGSSARGEKKSAPLDRSTNFEKVVD